MRTRRRNISILGRYRAGTIALALLTLSGAARAQLPAPIITETPERSGLIRRSVAIEPKLPPDPKRDSWYHTRWGDSPNRRPHPNSFKNGGLYGLPWQAKETASIYPYFYGSPGPNTMTENSKPYHALLRLPRNLLHPFKPVGMYYDQGSYVPIYDLDPLVPGPGAWPWPHLWSPTWGGG
jgi:hypothetical protein